MDVKWRCSFVVFLPFFPDDMVKQNISRKRKQKLLIMLAVGNYYQASFLRTG